VSKKIWLQTEILPPARSEQEGVAIGGGIASGRARVYGEPQLLQLRSLELHRSEESCVNLRNSVAAHDCC
jgi:hypothetical protein